jgi:hypothetical protein
MSTTSLDAAEQEAARLEASGRNEDALALCERILAEHHFDAADSAAVQAEAQFNQRRLRLRRKLGLPTWSSQGAPF